MPEKRVFLNLYSGDRFIFKIATHTSLYIEGDEYEWTYANTSEPTSTHGVTYYGIVYERPHKLSSAWSGAAAGVYRGFQRRVPLGTERMYKTGTLVALLGRFTHRTSISRPNDEDRDG